MKTLPHVLTDANTPWSMLRDEKPRTPDKDETLEYAARQFDSIVKALALGQTVSISSVQNCAAKCRAAIKANQS